MSENVSIPNITMYMIIPNRMLSFKAMCQLLLKMALKMLIETAELISGTCFFLHAKQSSLAELANSWNSHSMNQTRPEQTAELLPHVINLRTWSLLITLAEII